MIRLEVENYCHNYCPEFEADVSKIEFEDGNCNILTDTTISCKHKDICRSILNYLRKENAEGGE